MTFLGTESISLQCYQSVAGEIFTLAHPTSYVESSSFHVHDSFVIARKKLGLHYFINYFQVNTFEPECKLV